MATRLRLAAGLRISERGDGRVQIGLHADRRALLQDEPPLRQLLNRLRHPVDPDRLTPAERRVFGVLVAEGLLEPDAPQRHPPAAVELLAPEPAAALARRLLAEAALPEARADADPAVTLLVSVGAEPRRTDVDAFVQADRPHLLVTSVAGQIRIGPCVVPGLTACLRCLDEHQADRDPRHVRVVDQHVTVDHTDRPHPAELAWALAWAVRDVATLGAGEQPSTWSATVTLQPDGPLHQRWFRHPRCGCAWGDLLAG